MLKTSRVKRVLPFAALIAAFTAAPAQAAVTTSQVTSPADPHFALYDDSAENQSLTVRGTTDGAEGDFVEIRCTYSNGNWNTFASDVPVKADGTFEAEGPLGNLTGNPCRLRAVPAEGYSSLNRFRGPRVAVSYTEVSTLSTGGPNDGKLFDYYVEAQGFGGQMDIYSAGSGGLWSSSPYSTANFEEFNSVFYGGGGAFFPRDEQGSGTRSQLVVDGQNAYSPYDTRYLYEGSADAPGLQGLTVTRSQDPATGAITITETAPLVRCAANTTSPSAETCGEFFATGVTLERTWVTGNDVRAASVTDVLRSTDGAAHDVDLLFDVQRDCCEIGWLVPPNTEFERFGDGVVVPGSRFGSSPFTLVAKETDDEPDDSPEGGIGAIAFETAPAEIRFVSEQRFEANYVRSIPANGSTTLRHAFSQGVNVANTLGIARQSEDKWAAPSVTIESPAEGATVAATSVSVSGKASDSVGVTSVTVNGVAATLADDGAYAAVIPLTAGANTITVVARDAAGNTAEAKRTVTSNPPAPAQPATPAGPVAPASFTARLRPTRDRKAPFRLTVSGKLTPPSGKGAEACADGNVVVQTKAGRKTVSTRLAKLKANCTYSVSVSFKDRSRFGSRKSLRVLAYFLGNGTLKRTSAKQLQFRIR